MYITYTSRKHHNIYGVLLNFIFLIIKDILIYFPEQWTIFFLQGHSNFHLDRLIKKWNICIFQTIPWKELPRALWSPQGPTGPGKYDKVASQVPSLVLLTRGKYSDELVWETKDIFTLPPGD